MATSATTPANFTGSSAFSAQLQNVIAQAVASASGPLTQLQNQQTTLTSQQTELQTLATDFQSLQTATDSLNSVTGTGSYSASVDTPSVLAASVGSGVMAGSYSVNVSNIGSQTNTISMNGLTTVTDPSSGNIDASASYTLTVNGTNYQITDSAGSLNGLAQGLNASGANVQATVVNVGSSSSPDYRLSVQSLNYAPDTIQLSDGTNNLLNTLTTGSNVQYQVNGQPSTPISSNSRAVTISPGLTVNLLATGTANVDVSQSASSAGSAIGSFVNAYNSLVDELNKNRGQNGGALAGQSIVYELQNALQSMANYSASSGTLTSLTDVGISFDQNGHLQFDQSTFNAASPSDVLNFLGSEIGQWILAGRQQHFDQRYGSKHGNSAGDHAIHHERDFDRRHADHRRSAAGKRAANQFDRPDGGRRREHLVAGTAGLRDHGPVHADAAIQ